MTEILVAFGVVGAIALVVLARDLDPAWIIATGVAVGVFSGEWRYMGLPPSLDRVLILVGSVLALIKGWRRDRLASLPLRPIHYALLVLLLYAVCSAAWAGTLSGPSLFALLDDFGLIPFTLLVVAPVAFRSDEQRNALLVVLVVLATYLGYTAVCEGVGATALVFPHYITDSAIGINFGRARGPFVAADADGLALFSCLVACAVAWRVWTRPAARTLAAVAGLACAAGILFTVTRQIWLASAAAAIVTFLATPGLRRYLAPTAALTAVVVVALLLLVPGLHGRASSRFSDQSPIWDRYNSDEAALRMIGARPVAGFGWYSFADTSVPYLRLAHDYPLQTVGRAHNVFLSYAAELGGVAALLWLLSYLYVWLRGAFTRAGPTMRPYQAAVLAIGLSWLISSNFRPLSNAFSNYELWLWFGVGSLAWVDKPMVSVFDRAVGRAWSSGRLGVGDSGA